MSERQRLIAAYLKRTRAKIRADRMGKAQPFGESTTSPHSLVISCFESCPTAQCLFGSSPGEVLHHSEIAALVPPYDSHRSFGPYSLLAKLEYAVDVAGVRHLVVLGNSMSEGLEYLLEGTNHTALAGWVEVANMSLERAHLKLGDAPKDALLRETLRQAILQSVRNLLTYPCVYKSVKRGQITLNAWYYETGERCLYAYNADKEEFLPVLAGTGPQRPAHEALQETVRSAIAGQTGNG